MHLQIEENYGSIHEKNFVSKEIYYKDLGVTLKAFSGLAMP